MSELELELRELRIEWPETPDLAGRRAGAPGRAGAAPPLVARPARPGSSRSPSVALVVAVVMAIPPARAAVLDWLGFGSVRITREEPRPSRFGQALALGDPVTLDARRGGPRRCSSPRRSGEPDAVYLVRPSRDGPARRLRLPRAARPAERPATPAPAC